MFVFFQIWTQYGDLQILTIFRTNNSAFNISLTIRQMEESQYECYKKIKYDFLMIFQAAFTYLQKAHSHVCEQGFFRLL